jgi:hypothetical protein
MGGDVDDGKDDWEDDDGESGDEVMDDRIDEDSAYVHGRRLPVVLSESVADELTALDRCWQSLTRAVASTAMTIAAVLPTYQTAWATGLVGAISCRPVRAVEAAGRLRVSHGSRREGCAESAATASAISSSSREGSLARAAASGVQLSRAPSVDASRSWASTTAMSISSRCTPTWRFHCPRCALISMHGNAYAFARESRQGGIRDGL